MSGDAGEIYRAGLALAITLALGILRVVWTRLDHFQGVIDELNLSVTEIRNDQRWIRDKIERIERGWNGRR